MNLGHWHKVPHVRTGGDLTFGERAADKLKAAFGTWTLLGLIIAGIALWMGLIADPGELHLNLGLSFLASVQGVILQIAANRGDRIASEVALHTWENGKKLLEVSAQNAHLLEQNTELTRQVRDLTQQVHSLVASRGTRAPKTASGSGR